MRSDIVPGAIFPDYELSDHTAKRRKLSELQGPQLRRRRCCEWNVASFSGEPSRGSGGWSRWNQAPAFRARSLRLPAASSGLWPA